MTSALERPVIVSAATSAKRSFAPIVDERARVLVLGTLPGEESLRRHEYYAHPRNLFWPILFALFEKPPAVDYEAKLGFALAQRVALWDVCMLGVREASADATICREIPNAIDDLLASHRLIRAIAFNGTTAKRLYDRHFQRRPDITYLEMPSTSPAHARLDFAAKLAQWSALRRALDEHSDVVSAAPLPRK